MDPDDVVSLGRDHSWDMFIQFNLGKPLKK